MLRKNLTACTKKVRIRHPLDVLANNIGVERIKEKVKKPLKGLKVIPYYGCLLVRPYATFDNPFNPASMDRLIQALGAEPVDWALKTRCCGGTLSGTIQGVGLRLSYLLLKEASRKRGELLLTVCPLCQFALECFQDEMNKRFQYKVHMPVAYFSQLIGKAFNLSDRQVGAPRLFIPMKLGAAAASRPLATQSPRPCSGNGRMLLWEGHISGRSSSGPEKDRGDLPAQGLQDPLCQRERR